jgi:cellulose synthase/poly-beta-1,6-N-acetylglucosamine synthase-like glycosyltransferase
MLAEIVVGIYLTVIFLLNVWAINFFYIFLRFLFVRLKNGPFIFDYPSDYFPMVTFQLPIYNERPEMISIILESIYRQNYPKNLIEIIILDQSDDDKIISALQQVVNIFKRTTMMKVSLIFVDRFGDPSDTSTQFKAGSLNIATQMSAGDIFVVIDGDSYLDPNYLRYTIPHFSRKEIGLVLPRVTIHHRHKDIFACWNRITNHCYFIRNFIESIVGIPVGFLGSGAALRREVAEQFRWDTIQEDGCMGMYATTIGKWRTWFESKAVVFDEGIIYSLKDGKKKWARLSHGQHQIIKKMALDSENRFTLFLNPQILIKVILVPIVPFLILLIPFLKFFLYYYGISFDSWIGITLIFFSVLGSVLTFFMLYMVKKYGYVSDLLYYPLLPLNSIVCLVPGILAFMNAVFGRKRTFYRVQRISKAVPKTETSVKLIEASLAIFFLLAIMIFLHNLSALVFYTTYLVVMFVSFTNFRISPRKPIMELPATQQSESIASYHLPH